MSKFADFAELIQQCTSSNLNLNIIAIQEVWNVPCPELVNLPNYNFVAKTRKNLRGSGVAFFIKKKWHSIQNNQQLIIYA